MRVFCFEKTDWIYAKDIDSCIKFYEDCIGESYLETDFKECDIEKQGFWYGFDRINYDLDDNGTPNYYSNQGLLSFLTKTGKRKIKYDKTKNFNLVVWITFQEYIDNFLVEDDIHIICSTEY